MYEYSNVLENCVKYFDGDELAAKVCVDKYLLKNKNGDLLEQSPKELIDRISKELYEVESKYKNPLSLEEIKSSLDKFKYIIPGGSPLFGIGNNNQMISVGNCFVVDYPFDSYSGILQRDEELAQIMKRRGGVGIDISTLRPKDAPVGGAAVTSTGAISFMERYSNTTKEVAQGGRRGALMVSLSCNHPDLEEFINIKNNLDKITGANISVKWSDEFLNAVKNNKEYTLRFPVDVKPEDAKITRIVNAKNIWSQFVKANHKGAEPGCLFWDTIINKSISDCYADQGFNTVTTNPCGEITLSPYGACILMSVNLKSFVDEIYTEKANFNYDKFKSQVKISTRLMDDIIDIEIGKISTIIDYIETNSDKELYSRELNLWKKIRKGYEDGRRVGLGITGLADCLAGLGLKYGSKESLKVVDIIMNGFHSGNFEEQANLASERGCFKIWDWNKEKDSYHINILPEETREKIKKYGRRNISSTTCAPAGSISLLAQVTSGIEPLFMKSYKRMKKMTDKEFNDGIKPDYVDNDGIKWTSYEVVHKGVNEWLSKNPSKKIENSPYNNCEAGELNWKTRVELQSLIQKYITHSISSTVNLPSNTTIEEIDEIYMKAWESGCKGITIYRDGSRKGVLVKKEKKSSNDVEKRPDMLKCDIHYSNIEGNKWIFFTGILDNRLYEIFGGRRGNIEIPKKYKHGWVVKNGKNEDGNRTYDLYLGSLDDENEQLIIKDILSVFNPDTGSYTRIISTMLRHNIPIKFVCEQLYKDSKADMFTFEKGIARVLKKYINDGEQASGNCESCNSKLIYKDGCVQCIQCGWSKCN